jgi:hypothetical protein
MDVAGAVLGTLAVHPTVEPVVHEMPWPVTVPRPVPEVFAVRIQAAGANVAVAIRAPVIATVQTFPDTDVQPLHLEKTEPASGAAVSATDVAGAVLGTLAVQPAVEPVAQEMPGPVTVPRPVPEVFAVRTHWAGTNVADTVFALVIATVQTFPEIDVQPLQLENTDPDCGDAVSVTAVAGDVLETLAVQPTVEPVVQEMPSPVTDPRPSPDVSPSPSSRPSSRPCRCSPTPTCSRSRRRTRTRPAASP